MIFVFNFPLFGISLKYNQRHRLIGTILLFISLSAGAEPLTGYVVSIADGDTITVLDANLEQVKAGMAWWYEKYRKEQSGSDQRIYEQA